jgi:hypothetical protein
MACDRYKKWLMDRAVEVMPVAILAKLDVHLLDCASCREELDQQRSRLQVIELSLARSLSASPSAGFESGLRARLAQVPTRSGAISWIPAVAGALTMLVVLALHLIHPSKPRAPSRAVATISHFAVASARSDCKLSNLGKVGVNRKLKIQNPKLQMPAVKKALTVATRSRRGYSPRERGVEPDLRVVVEKGQWAAVVQLYDAVWSGRVDGAAFLSKDPGPIKIKPIEISEIKIAPIGSMRSHRARGGVHDPAETNKPVDLAL